MTILNKPVADLVHPALPLMSRSSTWCSRPEEKSLHTVPSWSTHGTESTPRLMFMLDHGIREGTTMTRLVSRQFVEIDAAEGTATLVAPYLSYDAPWPEYHSVVERVLGQPWLKEDLSNLALTWASGHS